MSFFRSFLARPAYGWALILKLLETLPVAAQGPTLAAGPAQLRMESEAGAYGVALFLEGAGTAAYRQATPMSLELESATGTSWLQGRYSQVTAVGRDTLVAQGTLRSANRTTFNFRDVYTTPGDSGIFFLSRQVTVSSPNAADRGFATRFSLPQVTPVALASCEFMIPGHLYRNTSSMRGGALAENNQAQNIFIRSDRLPLPLVMMREPGGNTLMIMQRNPDGLTILGDNTNRTLTDARLQYSSLGVHDRARPSLGLWFPGTRACPRPGTTPISGSGDTRPSSASPPTAYWARCGPGRPCGTCTRPTVTWAVPRAIRT